MTSFGGDWVPPKQIVKNDFQWKIEGISINKLQQKLLSSSKSHTERFEGWLLDHIGLTQTWYEPNLNDENQRNLAQLMFWAEPIWKKRKTFCSCPKEAVRAMTNTLSLWSYCVRHVLHHLSVSLNGTLFQILAPKSPPKTFTFTPTNHSQSSETSQTKTKSHMFTSHVFFFFESLELPPLRIKKSHFFRTSKSNCMSPRWSRCSGHWNQLWRHRCRCRMILILLPLMLLLYLEFVNFVFFWTEFCFFCLGFLSIGKRQWWNPQPSCVFSGMYILFLGFSFGSKPGEC